MGRIQAEEFLKVVTPPLNRGDVEALRDEVNRRWSPADLCCLLGHADLDTRRTVVVTLGIVGDRAVVGCLTRCLHDEDQQLHQFAEDALWSVWFRSGKCAAAEHFRAGIVGLTENDYPVAVAAFTRAVDIDPEFAEAYNQLAIAHYLSGAWDASRCACRKVLALMPTHFGAMAGLGHCYAHRGELPQAIDCYRRALAINPRMPTVADAKQRLEHQWAQSQAEGHHTAPHHSVLIDFDNDPLDRDCDCD